MEKRSFFFLFFFAIPPTTATSTSINDSTSLVTRRLSLFFNGHLFVANRLLFIFAVGLPLLKLKIGNGIHPSLLINIYILVNPSIRVYFDKHDISRTDDLYDLYDLFPLQFMISICQAGQIDSWSV